MSLMQASYGQEWPLLDSANLYFSYFWAMDVPGHDFGGLQIPTEQFIKFIQQRQKIFIYKFNHYHNFS